MNGIWTITKKHSCNYHELLESSLLLFAFLLSLIDTGLLVLFFLSLFLFLRQKSIGCVKALLIITTRSIVGSAAGVQVYEVFILKWVLVLIFAVLILWWEDVNEDSKRVLSRLLLWIVVFTGYVIFSSLFTSCYPIISIAKVASYSIVFYSIVRGVALTHSRFNWMLYFIKLLIPIFIISFVVIPFEVFRTRNGVSFQGILNHPNLFGITAALFIVAIEYHMLSMSKISVRYIFLITGCFFMQYISLSRTGMLSSALITLLIIFSGKWLRTRKILIMFLLCIIVLCIYLIINPRLIDQLNSTIYSFIYKNSNGNILASRMMQINNNIYKFQANPWFGSGFAVPYDTGIKDFSFSFDKVVEPGNIILALFGDVGVVGMALFLILYGYILFQNRGIRKILFIAPFLISFGEMVFFSVNNIGIYLFLFFAIYMFDKEEKHICAQEVICANFNSSSMGTTIIAEHNNHIPISN